jgi:hypothetical protein
MTTTNTASLDNTVVRLDTLYTAYESIFQEAQKQLESLELSDEDAGTLARKIALDGPFKRQVRDECLGNLMNRFKEDLVDTADSGVLTRLIEAITKQVEKHMTDQFYDMLNTQVKTFLESPELKSKVERAVLEHPMIHTATETRLTLRKLNTLLNNDSQQGTAE